MISRKTAVLSHCLCPMPMSPMKKISTCTNDICAAMCIDMCIEMCTDLCIGVCIEMSLTQKLSTYTKDMCRKDALQQDH